jgi:hypothetical protein
MWTVNSIRFDQTERETAEIQNDTEEKRLDTGESYRVVEIQSENKRLATDLLTEFVQGASKSGSVEDFVCYCSSNLLKCYKYL